MSGSDLILPLPESPAGIRAAPAISPVQPDPSADVPADRNSRSGENAASAGTGANPGRRRGAFPENTPVHLIMAKDPGIGIRTERPSAMPPESPAVLRISAGSPRPEAQPAVLPGTADPKSIFRAESIRSKGPVFLRASFCRSAGGPRLCFSGPFYYPDRCFSAGVPQFVCSGKKLSRTGSFCMYN